MATEPDVSRRNEAFHRLCTRTEANHGPCGRGVASHGSGFRRQEVRDRKAGCCSEERSDGVIVAIIQARMGSSRFPGKSLADLVGRPMLARVVERVQLAGAVARVIVA